MTTSESPKPKRILIGLRDIAGYGSALKRGFDEIGQPAEFLDLGGSRFDYSRSGGSAFVRTLSSGIGSIGRLFNGNFALRFAWMSVLQPAIGLLLLPYVLARFDAFVLLSGSNFFYFLELPLMRLCGKKVIHVYLGSDSRPAYLNGYVTGPLASRRRVFASSALALVQKANVRFVETFATATLNTPPQALFHARPFVNLFRVGLPIEIPRDEPSSAGKRPVTILHAPSKALPKRSAEIERLVEEARAEGFDVRFIRIENQPNHEVLRALRDCDLVIDEVYSDTPLSKFATEAAARGRPALVGGYYATEIEKDLPADAIPPSFFCAPETLKETLFAILREPESRARKGEAARAYVARHWADSAVARKFLSVFAGAFDRNWIVDPKRMTYVRGCGLSEAEASRNLRLLLRGLGAWAMWMGHHPHLESELVALSRKFPEASDR